MTAADPEDLDALRREVARLRDVESSLRQREIELRRADELRARIVEVLPGGIVHVDAAGAIQTANAEALRVLGLGYDELTRRYTTDFETETLNEDGTVCPAEAYPVSQALITGKKQPPMTIGVRRPDGTTSWAVFSAIPVRHPDSDAVSGAVVTFLDITERMATEAERKRLAEGLQHAQKLESLGVLAGGIAHDFNNLLVGILGNVGLARMKLAEVDDAGPLLDSALDAARRAAQLTRQMLAYSGKATVLVEPVEIRRLLVDTLEVLPALVPDHVRLVCEGGEALPLVRGDFTQLQQVVLNLALNGAEAITGEAGHVWLRAGLETIAPGYRPSGFLDAELSPGLHAYFEVADDGHGMDEATVRRIFDPFFTTKFTGRGLGLAVVLGIIRGHEGGIRIRTEPGGGTCVRVLLPATALRVPVAATPASADTSAPLSATVLVVDDDRVVREVAVRSLEMIGVDSLTAVDGLDALAVLALRAADIDLVLLDLTMPRLGGRETFRRLRALYPDIPVVLTSGYSEEEATMEFADGALADFLEKPYGPKDIAACVRRLLATVAAPTPGAG